MEKDNKISNGHINQTPTPIGYDASIQSRKIENFDNYFKLLNERVEKLISALYMVTDCLPAGDPIKDKLRALGVEVLSDTRSVALRLPTETILSMVDLGHKISNINSLLSVVKNIGFISEMNYSILSTEFSNLKNYLDQERRLYGEGNAYRNTFENEHALKFDFNSILGAGELPSSFQSPESTAPQVSGVIKDIHKGHQEHIGQSVRYNPKEVFKKLNIGNKNISKALDNGLKVERRNMILKLIKEKKQVSIKDIVGTISGCSEKTIQRELLSMVLKGELKREGEKRWSRYSIAK